VSWSKVVLHVDMDAFYAAVEVREDPSLAGKSLIIGHRGRRGVVSTCSYEARRFGVRSAMPSITAMRLCPDAVWLPGRMDLYVAVSRELRRIFEAFSPLVEPLSIDEAFLDLTGIARDFDAGARIARALKERIRGEQRITASVGIAPTKYLAKLASDLEKPDGLVIFPVEDVPARLWPMPVRRLWGVGPKSEERLAGAGIRTIGELLRAGEARATELLGPAAAAHLLALARGEDPRPVVPDRDARSISEERTYGEDVHDPDLIEKMILERAEGVARALRREGLAARTVHLKVRTEDFVTWTRALTLPAPTSLGEEIFAAARELFRTRIRLDGKGVRLLGVGTSHFEPEGAGQLDLFTAPARAKATRIARATDALAKKFGEGVVTKARLVRGKSGDKDPDPASSLPTVD
jgi:DNA polymerase IV